MATSSPCASWETLCSIHRLMAEVCLKWLNDPGSLTAFKANVIRQFLRDNYVRAERASLPHALRIVQSAPLVEPNPRPSYVAPDLPDFDPET